MNLVEEHKLNTPIIAHGEEVTILALRRPTVVECRAIKALPYKIAEDQSVTLDLEASAKYIAVCTGIPPSSVNQLELNDLNGLAWAVAGFFLAPVSKAAVKVPEPETAPS